MTIAKIIICCSAISGALAVMLGAFGAHTLKNQLEPNAIAVYQTAVEYQFYHTLALLFIGVLALRIPANPLLHWSAVLMGLGIIAFSGSLYLLAISGTRWLGAITPIGGVSFIVAWLMLVAAVWRANLS